MADELPEVEQQHWGLRFEPISRAMTNPAVIGPGGVHHVAGEFPEAEQQHCGALGLNQLAELRLTLL